MLKQTLNINTSSKLSKKLNLSVISLFQKSGNEYFDELVQFLCESTNAKFAFIGKYYENDHSITTRSFYVDSAHVKNFKYNLINTPCDTIVNKKCCVYPKDIQNLFPNDPFLKSFGVQSYIGIPLFDLSNHPIGVITIMDDKPMEQADELKNLLTLVEHKTELELDRVLLNEELAMSHKNLQEIFDNFQDVFFMINYNDRMKQNEVLISPSVKRTLGYSVDEISKLNFAELYHNPDERAVFLQLLKMEKQVKNYPLTFKKKDGSVIYVEIDAELIDRNSTKTNDSYILRGVLKDVTKKYKENLRIEIAYLIAEKSQRRLTDIKLLADFIHSTLNGVMKVSNFYFALHNENRNELYMPVFIDEHNKTNKKEMRIPFGNGLTEYVIKTKNVLVKDKQGLQNLMEKEGLILRGQLPECYVAVPLKGEGKCFGVMVMQSYEKGYHYKPEDIELLKFISTQVGYVIERTRWQEELIRKEEHYRSLVENSSEIIGLVNKDGVIQYISESVDRIVGYKPSEMIGHSLDNFIQIENLSEILNNAFIRPNKDEINLIRVFDKNGNKKYLETTLNINGTKKNELVFNAKDVTEVVVSEKKRKIANKHISDLRNAINSSSSVYFADIKTFKIIDVNKRLEKLTGYNKNELIGKTTKILDSDFQKNKKYIIKNISQGKTLQREMNYQKMDGSTFWVYETLTPVLSPTGEYEHFISIQFDITENKWKKTNLIREVIEAQEHERERFAMEIHDGLGQILLASKMNLSAVCDSSDGLDEDSKKILNNSLDLLTEAVQEARNISHGLMSRVLNKFGLAYAVNEIIVGINTTSNLKFEFKHNIEKLRFNEEIEMGIYRTLQELIKNIINHSKATKASLKIVIEEKDLYIDIRDNGIGIEKGIINNPSSTGIGLRNMRSRIEYLGGKFSINQKLKKGTNIKINISL